MYIIARKKLASWQVVALVKGGKKRRKAAQKTRKTAKTNPKPKENVA